MVEGETVVKYPCRVCKKEKVPNDMEIPPCGKPTICKECWRDARDSNAIEINVKCEVLRTFIDPSAFVEYTRIGNACYIDVGAKIGIRGLALTRVKGKTGFELCACKADVILEDRVYIGVNTIVQRGVTRDTVIGEGTKIGPMCNIGHDTIIGKNCRIAGMTQISGYVEIGDNVYISSGCNILNRVKIGSGAFIGIGSLVMHDIPENVTVYGRPAKMKK